ncbi:glutaredoxin domain-containing protein [Mobiluncus mulieris]|nr:glutaredoxin domain-containing protein [Mobiluncus mulieris]MCU9972133.1 NrdH-redoxin [Mobiluncus mulieris]MCU9975906.1 NrdH-redoxin [Mobiluncus mulieris]MCU9994396.1 NrdH-redoxin [Mobiluncus mulieris]MCV0014939.1 NrdH-redoxin [Mobiluncus mulieris]
MYTVKVFSLPNCSQCLMTRKYLEKQGMGFEEYDARDYAERWETLGFKSAPIVEICGPQGQTIDMWSGFQPSRISHYQPAITKQTLQPQPGALPQVTAGLGIGM